MQDIIEGLRKRNLKRAVNVYKNRKIDFISRKNVLKLCLFDVEKKREIIFDVPYRGIFNHGSLKVFLVNSNEFKTYDSNQVNEFLKRLKESGGFTNKTSVLVTDKKDYIIQHELQHVFDNIIHIKSSFWEYEYRAYLASLIYSEKPNDVLLKLVKYVNPALSEVGFEFFKQNLNKIMEKEKRIVEIEPHELSILKILVDLDNGIQEFDEKEIRMKSKNLMNENYVKNVGGNYDEILEELEKLLERY